MPRRFAAWNQEGWMIYGVFILIFGLIIGASLLVFAYNLLKASDRRSFPEREIVEHWLLKSSAARKRYGTR